MRVTCDNPRMLVVCLSAWNLSRSTPDQGTTIIIDLWTTPTDLWWLTTDLRPCRVTYESPSDIRPICEGRATDIRASPELATRKSVPTVLNRSIRSGNLCRAMASPPSYCECSGVGYDLLTSNIRGKTLVMKCHLDQLLLVNHSQVPRDVGVTTTLGAPA